MICSTGVLVPLSDYGSWGADIYYKAWVCTNPECGFNLRVDKGVLSIGSKPKEAKIKKRLAE
jgi:hypothetical protein